MNSINASVNKLSGWHAAVLVGFTTLFSHALLAFTSYEVWDGVIYGHAFRTPEGRASMWRLFCEAGRPLDMAIYWLASRCGSPVVMGRVIGLGSWVVSSVLFTQILLTLRLVPPVVAVALGCVAGALPVFGMLGDFTFVMHTFCVLLFWLGATAFVVGSFKSGATHILWRLCSLCLFFFSFNLSSLLVFFYTVVVAFIILEPRWQLSLAGTVSELAKRADFLALPLAFWLLKTQLTPTSGYYLNYNQPRLGVDVLLSGISGTWTDFLVPHLGSALPITIGCAFLVFALGCVLRKNTWLSRLQTDVGEAISVTVGGRLMLAGAILLVGAILPYSLVGQGLAHSGWLSRNAILTPVPLSLMLVGVTTVVASLLPKLRGATWLFLCSAFIMCSTAQNVRNYLALEGLGAKQESITNQLLASFGENPPSLVQLKDYFVIPNTIYYYPPIVWTYLLARGLPVPQTFVIETAQIAPDEMFVDALGTQQRRLTVLNLNTQAVEQAIEQTTMPYAMTGIPRHGTQALAILEPTEMGNDGVTLGWEYLKARWLQPGQIPQFLERLTSVQVQELPSIPAD